ncbi:MAG: NAD(P)-dependent oxidoreductase [Bacteroidales bacterium]|nr:NAD(P)-dependent oxidoreductase [Bacteroidales bacterium]MBN2757713.1 NAD(P)-dependent oxidoreductase [Bacteroidales bacterium]
MKKILVSGGAGYIGSVLVKLLLESGYKVRVIDNLRFGGEAIIDLLNNPNFEFIKGDTRNDDDLKLAVQGVDYIAHLAAIVGDPACAKEPDLARATNLDASKNFYKIANENGVKKFVFASTCSNYGKMKDENAFVNEESELSPVSLYAETKVAVEQFLLSQDKNNVCKPTNLRFSTVYGLSPRIRFDLTVNEFTKELALGRELVIFGEQFWRPYCHVIDLARGVKAVFEAEDSKVAFEVFNVGDTNENYQKQMIVEEIRKQLPEAKIKYVKRDEDPRDYRVNFDKISNKLGYKITKKVPEGVEQIIKVIKDGFLNSPDDGKYKNI